MIDKNDVKMPEQNDNMEALLGDKDKVRKIEDLLDMVSDVENKQELRLKSDYYARFHWFGGNNTGNKSYFSYQEEAVYDFIFNLNKSGILSDQVGMGKTIEAGMIISELASRNELRSLLIIVPNEIMAEKWEYELENKFGIKPYRRNAGGVEEIYPEVVALKSYSDFCKCVFDCIAKEKFVELYEHRFSHRYDAKNAKEGATLDSIIKGFVDSDIKEAVEMINRGLEAAEIDGVEVIYDGSQFAMKGTDFKRAYKYDNGGEIAKFLSGKQRQKMLESTINNAFFQRQYERIMKQELSGLYTLIGDYFTTIPEEISAISEAMTTRYPILVIPISYSEHKEDRIIHHDFLNRVLLKEIKNYKHKYIVQTKDDETEEKYENYRIVDFFIDVGYQTMIVDEVHDYIDVSAKVARDTFHKNNESFKTYPSDTYDRYELFDDYYFIKKSSLYKKLKTLADKATRKIFLTATPIKSDMVDFYLLTLLASNKDADAYKHISDNLDLAFPRSKDREEAIANLYETFKLCTSDYAAKNFIDYRNEFLKREKDDSGKPTGRYVYQYFNNSFLTANTSVKAIQDYLISQISYMSMQEIILNLIISYNIEKNGSSSSDLDIKKIVVGNEKNNEGGELIALLSGEHMDFKDISLQTRVVFRALFDNNIKVRFEEDFTTDGKPIKRIRQLLELEEGARKWNKTYGKYGIRHTRHQTYNLDKCSEINKLSPGKQSRYRNLPLWPKRDGKVIYLVRDDIFFDCFLDVKRECEAAAPSVIKLQDLPNYDRLSGTPEEKEERFADATAIFDFINDSMSGGIPGTHEPSSSRYESVDLDDSGMVDYKLALVNKLMVGRDSALGRVKNKVLLFAENNRDEITDWFRYQKCAPLYDGSPLDEKKANEYQEKWRSYTVDRLGEEWKVSEDAADLSRYDGNLLIIIDPKRYEKGVDLQKADTLINFDINYDPLKMEQRIGRIDRIRPTGTVPAINIVSFVPMNDMSGFVINFFANELKMFTQWMGETTGIVSVEEEAGVKNAIGEDVSFEGKVKGLEKYYRYIYDICKENLTNDKILAIAEDFEKRFVDEKGDNKIDKVKADIDFRFLRELRADFDRAFRNSVSTGRAGYATSHNPNSERVMRFNSSLGVFMPCASKTCQGCPNAELCKRKTSTIRNNYKEFFNATRSFFNLGQQFYKKEQEEYTKRSQDVRITGGAGAANYTEYLRRREKMFRDAQTKISSLLPAVNENPFTMPIDKYNEIFGEMKKLYWDSVVNEYLKLIIDMFHQQCDSVLKGARLFERFVKTLSIADFMKNMEGNV